MEAAIIPPTRSGGENSRGRLSFAGHLYRCRKPLVDGQFRRKRSRAGKNFSYPGYAVTDGVVQGCVVGREGPHTSHCEPRASASEVATIRGDVIWKSGAFGGVTPLRAVALSVADASEEATHTLPNSAQLKRSARNAIYRARKKSANSRGSGRVAQLPKSRGAVHP